MIWKTCYVWVLQMVMRRLTRLATMEVKREDTTCYSMFWQILNNMLSEVKNQQGYKFNPKMFIVDEAEAVAAGIRNVFGEVGCRKAWSCQFHYKMCLDRALNNIPDELAEEFRELALELLEVSTIKMYEEKTKRMQILAQALPSAVQNWCEVF